MPRCSFRRSLAALVAVAITAAVVPGHAWAAGPALLRGRVLDAEASAPLAGVVVQLLDTKTRESFPSSPTDERGVFAASAPAGTYRLVAETRAGAFLASGSIELASGKNTPVALTLERRANAADDAGSGAADPGQKPGLKPWAKWTIVGAIGVTALLAFDSISSDETPASGF